MRGPMVCGIVANDLNCPSFVQGQAEQQYKLVTHMAISLYFTVLKYKDDETLKVLSSLFSFCHLCFLCMPQLILHLVLDNSISCLNVRYLFRLFPHSVSDI